MKVVLYKRLVLGEPQRTLPTSAESGSNAKILEMKKLEGGSSEFKS
jgi:hypothetical protein